MSQPPPIPPPGQIPLPPAGMLTQNQHIVVDTSEDMAPFREAAADTVEVLTTLLHNEVEHKKDVTVTIIDDTTPKRAPALVARSKAYAARVRSSTFEDGDIWKMSYWCVRPPKRAVSPGYL